VPACLCHGVGGRGGGGRFKGEGQEVISVRRLSCVGAEKRDPRAAGGGRRGKDISMKFFYHARGGE